MAEKEESFEVNFVADVHLIQILGEQLIGSEKVGILELIKNAYDAGAASCDVWIEKVPGLPEVELSDPEIAKLPGPVITIVDDGSGMDKNTILNGWLRPATRIKTSVKERLKRERKEADDRGTLREYESLVNMLKKEHGGRLPLGEKGVGRFATHRLGQHLLLQTKIKNEPYEWMLEINWDDFIAHDDQPRNLQDVHLNLVQRDPQRDYGPTGSGTMVRIYGGREGFEWTSETLYDIGQAIALLRSSSKNTTPIGFNAYFHCPQLSDEKFEVPTNTVPAPFLCTAIVDEEGKAEIEIQFIPPSSLSNPIPPQNWIEPLLDLRETPPEDNLNYWQVDKHKSRLRLPACGPFTVEIKLWLRAREWIESADVQEFTQYLDKFGGIGIYRDGLSILPAQIASKDDWLRLSNRRIKKVENISYYQIWGSVDLLQESTLGLVDRTSREGMLETRPFSDLRELVRVIVLTLEFRVKETRRRYNRLKQGDRIPASVLNKRAQILESVLKTVSTNYDFKTDPLNLGEVVGISDEPKKTMELLMNTVNELRREVSQLNTQSDALLEPAGYGISISVAVHEIEKITSNLYFGLDRLYKRALGCTPEVVLQIRDLGQTAQSLLNELRRIAPLRVTRLEKQTKFRVRDSILAASGAFQLSWENLKIQFALSSKSHDFEITGSFGACSQVFANLFDNATYWLNSSEIESRRIIVQMDPVERKVVVADSGPGIADKMRPHLFELFYSLKNPPSGLGLYICQYYMQQIKGTVRESSKSEILPGVPGAHFTVIFPKEEE